MIRQELNPETCRLDTKQCRYVYTGPGGCLRWPPTPPGPRWPPALKLELERERTKEEKEREVLHLFRCYTHTQLTTTQRTHTCSSTHNLLHANPAPSLFSFLLSPCHLYLSFAACWKKLTCGVIRSFNYLLYLFVHMSSICPNFTNDVESL